MSLEWIVTLWWSFWQSLLASSVMWILSCCWRGASWIKSGCLAGRPVSPMIIQVRRLIRLPAVLAFLVSILGCNLFDMSIASPDSPSQISSESFSLCRVPDPICGDLERPLMCHGVSTSPTLIPFQVISVPRVHWPFLSSDLPTLFLHLCLFWMV